MKNYLKRPLAGVLALSLMISSASLQTFADEIRWSDSVLSETVTATGTTITAPANVVNITTKDGGYAVNDSVTIYVDKNQSLQFDVELSNGTAICDDGVVLAVSNTKAVEGYCTFGADNAHCTMTLTGKKTGTYTVIVAAESGKANQKINVVVLDPITSIKMKKDGQDIETGLVTNANRRINFSYTPTPTGTTDNVEWSVDDTDKAEISSDGILTAKQPGTITVTASAVNSYYDRYDYSAEQLKAYGLNARTFSASVNVTILKANPITDMSFDFEDGKALNLNTGDVYNAKNRLSWNIEDPNNASTDEIIWMSSDPSVVKVDEKTGMLTAQNKSGFATVTAMTDSVDPVKTSFVVNVSSPASVLKFSSDKYMLDMGEKNEADIMVLEAPNTADEPLVCTVTDGKGVVEVIGASDGKTPDVKIFRLRALSTGEATVTVGTDRTPTEDNENPQNIFATCKIEVVESVASYVSFKIKDKPEDVIYSGEAQMLKPVVTDSAGNELTEDKDYTLTYSEDVINAGVVNVRVTGIESAAQYGTEDVTYSILPADMSGITKPVIADMTYNYGNELKPSSTSVLRYKKYQLVLNKDFTVDYTDNTDAGAATALFTGIGNYTGEFEVKYNILPRNISGARVNNPSSFTYTGDEIIPEYILTMNSGAVTLVENEDYTTEISNNVNVGTARVVFTGTGNYTGTLPKNASFKITRKNVAEDDEVNISDIPDQEYMGGMPIEPEPEIIYNGRKLTKDVDYTLSYTDNKFTGKEACITVDFNKSANFTGTLKKYFTITSRNVKNPAKVIKATDENGNVIANDAILYIDVNDTMDIDIAIDDPDNSSDDCLLVAAMQLNNKNATASFVKYSKDGKTGTVRITGAKKGSFEIQISSMSGEVNKKLRFTVLQPAKKIEIYNDGNNVTDSGVFIPENHQTAFTIKYTPATTTDSVEWFVDDTSKAEISKDEGVLTAKKSGSVMVTAKIKPSETSERGLSVSTVVTVVKANPITKMNFPFKEISLKTGSTYKGSDVLNKSILDSSQSSTDEIIWTSSNQKVAKVNSLTGDITVMNVKGSAVITATTDSLTPVSASFTINAFTPVTTMTFSSQSYTLLTGYESEIQLKENPSTANEKVEWEVSDDSVLQIIDSTYNAESNVQLLKVKALRTGDCKITARTVRIPTIKEPEPVQVEATCGIVVVDPVKMSNTTVTLSATSYEYNGKAQKPAVTVKYNGNVLSEKTDYTVSYINNTDIGTAKVTVTGVGRYMGSVNKEFKIKLPAVKGFAIKSKTDTSVIFSWNRNSNATGYIIEKQNGTKWTQVTKITSNGTVTYTASKLSAASTHTFRIKAYKTVGNSTYYSDVSKSVQYKTPLGAVGGFKRKSGTSNSLTLQWVKNSSATGYELQRYANNKWTTVTKITKNSTVTYTVNKLKASTAYKFRIRAYKGSTYSAYKEISANTNPTNVGGFKRKSGTSSSVTLQWNKNTSATGYELQQYKNNKWTTITKITNNSTVTYTVKSLKASTSYKFRIRSYKTIGKSNQYSGYTNLTANTNPTGVSRFTARSTARTSITLGWSKNTTAGSYEIQQYKGGKWVKITTISKNTTTSYTVKNLKKNTSYKFRIRALKKIGSSTQYSGYSTITAKTKK